MQDVFLVYDTSCFYEIITLNYFMRFSGCDVVLCSMDGKPVKTMEGYSVNVDASLHDIAINQVRSFILPGGNTAAIDIPQVWCWLRELRQYPVLIAGICAGVDVLDHAGILYDLESTHSADLDLANDQNVITARANAYVDFAIEVAKELNLFTGEADLQETIEFWKFHRRMQ